MYEVQIVALFCLVLKLWGVNLSWMFEFYVGFDCPGSARAAFWNRQALAPASFPPALPDRDFVAPGGDTLHCHDGRRNFTDLQETAQWLGGINVPKAILTALCSGWVLLCFVEAFC